ncbi:alcohol dehydrogenase IV [Amylostereum chailletii]|nr:alcohol dehydrogenase IV [Amylostereum chailletii]
MSAQPTRTNASKQLHGYYAWTDTLKGIYYGPGSLSTALPKLRTEIGGNKALIVTGKSLYHKTDVVKKVEDLLKADNAHAGTFYEIGEHSPIAGIRKGVEVFREVGADHIISVGGGSPIDASKAILKILHDSDGGEFGKQIAIPTTLSAAEYTFAAGYTDEQGQKVAVMGQQLVPAGIILDAELTLSTPERLWLSTGLRALDHAVENLYHPLIIPPLKPTYYQAISDLFTYLPRSKADPNDIEARQKLQLAAWMSLWPKKAETFSALGLSHSLGHKLGATYGIPHGITSCLTLAPTVRLKASIAAPEDKQSLADSLFYLREPSTGSVEGDVLKLSELIDELVTNLGLKSNLEQYNVPREDLAGIAERALGAQLDDVDKVVGLLESIYKAPDSDA